MIRISRKLETGKMEKNLKIYQTAFKPTEDGQIEFFTIECERKAKAIQLSLLEWFKLEEWKGGER